MKNRPTNKELHDAFHATPDNPSVDCRSLVMDRIHGGRVTMRSRWFVLTQELGIRTSWIVLVLSLVGVLNLSLFLLSRSPAFEFADFGIPGYGVMLKNMPYGWWALAFTLLVVAIVVMKRFSWSYIWPLHVFSFLLISGVFAISGGAFAAGINDYLYRRLVEEPGSSKSFLAKIYCLGAHRSLSSPQAMIGEVMYVEGDSIVVQTPELEVYTVMVDKNTVWRGPEELNKFQVVKMIGKRDQDVFHASWIKADQEDEQLNIARNEADCIDQSQWQQKQQVVKKRREAASQPYTPQVGTAQFIKSIY
jgi:hypothetical protein